MMTGIVATAETDISASPARVWDALVDPDQIKQYMFGSEVETDWQPGSAIVWKGEYEGKAYQDKGQILAIEPQHKLVVTHFSPMSGQPDVPANYHTLTYVLDGDKGGTHLSLSQDNNGSQEEAEHSKANWQMMLTGIKKLVETG
jgi:uncharacterized protein YndB with AHSA1/START domain